MVVVHHLNNSRSQRVLWLLEELELPYEVKRYERDPKTMLAPPSLLAIHPLGKSPVIVDGGVTVAESGAIIEYLVDKYGGGRLIPPAGSRERLRYTYWLHYAEGSAMTPLLFKLVFDRVAGNPAPWPVSAIARRIAATVTKNFIAPNLTRHLDYIEAELGTQAWFAGAQFTAADVQMSFPLEIAVSRAGLNASRPNSMAFLERIHARDAYKRALERGGKYDYQ
ncbi:MAG: glutathione S-transferase [Gammaproteobacteria bacterium]|jgi:glutathione S-transferase|nr:gstA [Gammaproteobacteria bacterium]MEA3140375.1 glutathione S-transferase [Gammaproteobacteria bacterium]